jgi:hypothetical protein
MLKGRSRQTESIPSCRSGIVVNSYYGRDAQLTTFCDVALQDEGGTTELLAKVPVLKVGGLSQSLPPIGSTAIVVYIDNNDQRPIVVGTIDSKITEKFVEDNKRPRRPPTNLTR